MTKGNFIEYVISDISNKYPNNGEQDGYYYKRVITETEEKTVTAGTSPIEVIPSEGKSISKVTVNPTPTEEKTVTPTTENLIVAPVEGKQLSQVTVQGDANFLEENIAEGVTMWGKTGTHQGGTEIQNGKIANYISFNGDISENTFVEFEKIPIINDNSSLVIEETLGPVKWGSNYSSQQQVYFNLFKSIDGNRIYASDQILHSVGEVEIVDGKLSTKNEHFIDISSINYPSFYCELSENLLAYIGRLDSSSSISAGVVSIGEIDKVCLRKVRTFICSDDDSTIHQAIGIARVGENKFVTIKKSTTFAGGSGTNEPIIFMLFEYIPSSSTINLINSMELPYNFSYGIKLFNLNCGSFVGYTENNIHYFKKIDCSNNTIQLIDTSIPFTSAHGRDITPMSIVQIGNTNSYIFGLGAPYDFANTGYYCIGTFNNNNFNFSTVKQLTSDKDLQAIACLNEEYFIGFFSDDNNGTISLLKLQSNTLNIINTIISDVKFSYNTENTNNGFFPIISDGKIYTIGRISINNNGTLNMYTYSISCGTPDIKVKVANKKVDGITKTAISPTKAGEVWILNR